KIKNLCEELADNGWYFGEQVCWLTPLGNIDEDAKEASVTRELLDRWRRVSMPLLSCVADHSTASLLTWVKVRQQLLQGDWLTLAKHAAQNLKAAKNLICMAAEERNQKFFIYLGKCLSGEIKSTHRDIDHDIAYLINNSAPIKARDAVRELNARGW